MTEEKGTYKADMDAVEDGLLLGKVLIDNAELRTKIMAQHVRDKIVGRKLYGVEIKDGDIDAMLVAAYFYDILLLLGDIEKSEASNE